MLIFLGSLIIDPFALHALIFALSILAGFAFSIQIRDEASYLLLVFHKLN